MSYSGNLYLPSFVRFDKKTTKISSDETIHGFRKEFLENKTHKNTYVIIYGDYNYYFEKSIKILENEIVEYETPSLFSTRENIFLNYDKRKIFLKEKIKESLINLSKNKKVLLIYPSPISPSEHSAKSPQHASCSHVISVPVFERWCSSLRHNRVRIRALIFE